MNVSVSSVDKYIASGLKQCKQSLHAQGYDIKEQNAHEIQSSEERKQ